MGNEKLHLWELLDLMPEELCALLPKQIKQEPSLKRGHAQPPQQFFSWCSRSQRGTSIGKDQAQWLDMGQQHPWVFSPPNRLRVPNINQGRGSWTLSVTWNPNLTSFAWKHGYIRSGVKLLSLDLQLSRSIPCSSEIRQWLDPWPINSWDQHVLQSKQTHGLSNKPNYQLVPHKPMCV